MLNYLKIISWNCGGKFRVKYKHLREYGADVYVIQECEAPLLANNHEYELFTRNGYWIGENKNKGLGLFAQAGISIVNLSWESYGL